MKNYDGSQKYVLTIGGVRQEVDEQEFIKKAQEAGHPDFNPATHTRFYGSSRDGETTIPITGLIEQVPAAVILRQTSASGLLESSAQH